MSELKIEAVAVSLLWSIMNASHELRLGALIEEHLPGVPYSLGHQVNPTIREYRRTSAVAIDASLKPLVKSRLAELESRLRDEGFSGVITFVTSNSGRTSSADVISKPVYLCLSGPSAAPKAACRLAYSDGEVRGDVITIDMGGTSFDVSVSTGGIAPIHREGMIGGHLFGVRSVDVMTVGAGGGSIGWVDDGGFLHVGPESAGAYPGPACYDRGGDRPTVTDANLVRGVLGGRALAEGQINLSMQKARASIERQIAVPLKSSVEEAANLMCVAVEQNLVAAIESITVRRGIDPRDYLLVCGGAASGAHVAAIAAELGMRRVLIPDPVGVLSAYGIGVSEIRFDFSRSFFASSREFDFDGVARSVAELERDARDYLERMNVAKKDHRFVLTAECRYTRQVWQLTLPIQRFPIRNKGELAALVEQFHKMHETVYTVCSPDEVVEFVEWTMQAMGQVPKPPLLEHPATPIDADSARIGSRAVVLTAEVKPYRSNSNGGSLEQRPLSAGETVLQDLPAQETERNSRDTARSVYERTYCVQDLPVYDQTKLEAGHLIDGPALIDAPLTTILIPPASRAWFTRNRGLMIEIR